MVASNISLLAPHLGGKAYPIRSAIVTAIGHLIQKAFGPSAVGADAQGSSPCLNIAICCPVLLMFNVDEVSLLTGSSFEFLYCCCSKASLSMSSVFLACSAYVT